MIGENILTALSDAMVQAVEIAGASTVRVDARKGGSASGVAFEAGWILTASHAIEREADIRVELPDGSQVKAQSVGRDLISDLCLLKLESRPAVPAVFAQEPAKVGQIVLALGRPTNEGIQASLGVVGAVGGPLQVSKGGLLERFIRTDAIPYPGFSGGPLVDSDGHVLGINTSGFAPGASLAIPADFVRQAARMLQSQGRIKRGFLGIRTEAVELPAEAVHWLGRSQRTGLLLVSIERGQPAERSGMMVGDILVGFDGGPVESHDQLLQQLALNAAGKTLEAELLRGGRLVRLNVLVSERS